MGRLSLSLLGVMWAVSTSWNAVEGHPAGGKAKGYYDVAVYYNQSEQNRMMLEESCKMFLDEASRRMTIKCGKHPLDVGSDDVQKIVLDDVAENNYMGVVEYKARDGAAKKYLFEFYNKEDVGVVREKLKNFFPDKVQVANFPEKEEKIKADTLKERKTKIALTMDKSSHPIPEAKADKALVVVIAPFFTNFGGHAGEFRLWANGSVVAANRLGSYSFAYLEPGDCLLAAGLMLKEVPAVRIQLEAGKEYYFFLYWSYNVQAISRNTKEVAAFMMDGVDLCQWKRK